MIKKALPVTLSTCQVSQALKIYIALLFIMSFILISSALPNLWLYASGLRLYLAALFNNMRTLKFKSQPTNAFFATVNQLQMFGGFSQLSTTAERAVIKSNRRVQFRQHGRKLGGAAEHLIHGTEKRICRLNFEF